MKKLFSTTALVIVLVLILNTMAFAETNVNNRVTPFKDVSSNYWSLMHIIKMSYRGVTSGYLDGTFQPDKMVTQIEALLMAIRSLEATDELNNIDVTRSLAISVPVWVENSFKKELLFALDKGLIIPSENNFEAAAFATRAWMAQLLVRVIDKEAEVSQFSTQQASFTDAVSIPDWAVGHVNTAVKYNLIAGYTDNSFKPYQVITRSQTVTFLSRTEQYLNLGKIVKARITGINGANYSLSIEGNLTNVTINSDTWCFNESGKNINFAELQINDYVKAVIDENKIKYLELVPADSLNVIKGSVIKVLSDEKVLIIKDELEQIHTKKLASNAIISSFNGNNISLSNITIGSNVELSLNVLDEIMVVQLTNGTPFSSNSAIIYDIMEEQSLIILKDSTGNFATYQFTDQTKVILGNERFPKITDLQIGDQVKVTVSSKILTVIELIKAKQELTILGKVIVNSTDKRILAIQKDIGIETYPVADNVIISIQGLNYPLLSDILIDDEVELKVEEGKITYIYVKNRSYESFVKGTVTAVDSTNGVIVIKNDNNELKSFFVSSRAEFLINDKSYTSLSYVKRDMKVEIQLVNDEVIYLETKNTIEGTLVTLNENRRIITIKDNNGKSQTYFYSSDVDVDIEDVSSADVDDIGDNSYLEIRVEGDIVTEINVQTILNFEVVRVYDTSNKIKVEDEDENSDYIYLDSRVNIVIPGISKPTIDDFATGDTVKATYLGHRLQKVEVVSVIMAEITDISYLSSVITVKTFEGASLSYKFDNKSNVINGVQNSTILSSLALNDRVQIKQNLNGGFSFLVMKKVVGKFLTISDNGEKIYLIQDGAYPTYNLAEKCYVHDAYRQITTRSLLRDDQVTLYILNDTVYEIKK